MKNQVVVTGCHLGTLRFFASLGQIIVNRNALRSLMFENKWRSSLISSTFLFTSSQSQVLYFWLLISL